MIVLRVNFPNICGVHTVESLKMVVLNLNRYLKNTNIDVNVYLMFWIKISF